MTAMLFRAGGWFRTQSPVILVALGHGAVHWAAAVLYLLLPFMREDLGMTYAEAAALMSVFHVSQALANLPAGPISDMTGRKVAMMATSLVLCGAALFVMGTAASWGMIAAMLAMIGITNMAWHPPALSYLSARYPDRRGFAISMHMLGSAILGAAAPVVAGTMLLWMTWQQTAMANAIVAPAVALAMVLVMRGTDRGAGGKHDTTSLADYTAGLRRLLRTGAVVTLCAMAGFRNMTQAGVLVFLPLYLADVMNFPAVLIGTVLMMMQLAGAFAGPAAGILSDRIGRRPLVVSGLWGMTAMVIALPFIGDATVFVFGVSLLGFFIYAVRPVIQSWAMDLSEPRLHGSVASLIFGTEAALAAVVPLVGGLIADRYGLVTTFYFLASGVLVANVLAPLVPAERRPAVA
ncbi:MAG: MFS transporter [Acetobacterales bacterium]